MAIKVATLIFLALVSCTVGARVGNVVAKAAVSEDSTCTACLVATRVMSDLLCDPATGDFVLDLVVQDVCPALGADADQCQEFATALVPVAIEWLRASATPASMCAAAGVCKGQAALGDPELARARFRYHDSADCPLCKFVVGRTQAALAESAPDADAVKAAAQTACKTLPAELWQSCVAMVAQRGGIFASFLGTMDAEQTCAAAGVCNEALMAVRPQPLPAALAGALVALHGVQQLGAGLGTSTCDTCKMTVLEMHMLLTNPTIQEDVRTYAKVLCGSLFPNQADSCASMVDLYAPLVFQQLDIYIQPDPICQGIHMCPPPSLYQTLASALLTPAKGSLAARFAGLLPGRTQATATN